MSSSAGRILILALGIVAVFFTVAAILSQVIPSPHKNTDYLVIGSVATFVSLLVLFAILLKTWVKQPDVFYKQRKKPPDDV